MPESFAWAHLSLRTLHIPQHFFGVPVRFHVLENVRDLSVRPDQECGTGDTQHFLAVHVLFLDHAELVGDCLVLISQQRIGQLVLVLELLLGGRCIGRDSEYGDSGPGQFAVCVAEPARFDGSTGGIGFRIEEQDNRLAAKLLQLDRVPILIR